jgi:hypothetical protein
MIKKYWAYFILAFSILFFVYKKFFVNNKIEKANLVFASKIIKTTNGFGYDIFIRDSIYISQKSIPAINKNIGFSSASQAQAVANFVIDKLQKNPNQFPAITINELDSLKINY